MTAISNIFYFHYIHPQLLKNIPLKEGTAIPLDSNLSRKFEKEQTQHLFVYLSSNWFDEVNSWHMDDLAEDGNGIKPQRRIRPMSDLLSGFLFLQLSMKKEGESSTIVIANVYDTAKIFSYWLRRNRYSDDNKWKYLGITQQFWDKMPDHHCYIGHNYSCTCGTPGCDEKDALLIKIAEHDYCILFILDAGKLVFNINYFDNETTLDKDWADTFFDEEKYAKHYKDYYFPFPLLAKDFKLHPDILRPIDTVLQKWIDTTRTLSLPK